MLGAPGNVITGEADHFLRKPDDRPRPYPSLALPLRFTGDTAAGHAAGDDWGLLLQPVAFRC